mgnify:CR=1 FL=1
MAKKKDIVTVTPEWSHPVNVTELETRGKKLHIEADPAQRAALASRLGVVRVEKAQADVELVPQGASVHVTGHLTAAVIQNCVVSLQPLNIAIDEEFDGWFADPDKAVSFLKARHEKIHKGGQVEMPILEENEDPEAIIDGHIDIGELATQYFSLAINPYPHAEGVKFEVGDDTPQTEMPEERKNPFAALKDWKSRYNKDQV